jgi:hypothetical protein
MQTLALLLAAGKGAKDRKRLTTFNSNNNKKGGETNRQIRL